MKVVFGSVIYPDSIRFFDDYISSVNNQKLVYFSLFLINDGIDDCKINDIKKKIHVPFIIVNNDEGLSPSDLRVKLIMEAKRRNFDLLIIGDSDDKFANDRVHKTMSLFEDHEDSTFFYNDLRFFDSRKVMPDMPTLTNSILDIIDYNYLGLSNTAIRLKSISEDFIESLFGSTDYAFDWYLYSRLLEEGKIGRYVPSVTYYRIYEGNAVGNIKRSEELIKKEKDVKLGHYRQLSKYSVKCKDMYDKYVMGRYCENNGGNIYFWWNFLKALEGENDAV